MLPIAAPAVTILPATSSATPAESSGLDQLFALAGDSAGDPTGQTGASVLIGEGISRFALLLAPPTGVTATSATDVQTAPSMQVTTLTDEMLASLKQALVPLSSGDDRHAADDELLALLAALSSSGALPLPADMSAAAVDATPGLPTPPALTMPDQVLALVQAVMATNQPIAATTVVAPASTPVVPAQAAQIEALAPGIPVVTVPAASPVVSPQLADAAAAAEVQAVPGPAPQTATSATATASDVSATLSAALADPSTSVPAIPLAMAAGDSRSESRSNPRIVPMSKASPMAAAEADDATKPLDDPQATPLPASPSAALAQVAVQTGAAVVAAPAVPRQNGKAAGSTPAIPAPDAVAAPMSATHDDTVTLRTSASAQTDAVAVAVPAPAKADAPRAIERPMVLGNDPTQVQQATPTRPEPSVFTAIQRTEAPAQARQDPNPLDRAVAQQVSRAIVQHLPDGGTCMVMRLTPPELGTVRIEFLSRDGMVTARLMADDEGVRQALDRALPHIRAEVRGDHPTLDITVDRSDQRQAWSDGQARHERRDASRNGQARRRREDEPVFAIDGVEPAAMPAPVRAAPQLGGRISRSAVDALA